MENHILIRRCDWQQSGAPMCTGHAMPNEATARRLVKRSTAAPMQRTARCGRRTQKSKSICHVSYSCLGCRSQKLNCCSQEWVISIWQRNSNAEPIRDVSPSCLRWPHNAHHLHSITHAALGFRRHAISIQAAGSGSYQLLVGFSSGGWSCRQGERSTMTKRYGSSVTLGFPSLHGDLESARNQNARIWGQRDSFAFPLEVVVVGQANLQGFTLYTTRRWFDKQSKLIAHIQGTCMHSANVHAYTELQKRSACKLSVKTVGQGHA